MVDVMTRKRQVRKWKKKTKDPKPEKRKEERPATGKASRKRDSTQRTEVPTTRLTAPSYCILG